MKAEPPPLTDEETALRNEKIRVDDFQEKLVHASRKVGLGFLGSVHTIRPLSDGTHLHAL